MTGCRGWHICYEEQNCIVMGEGSFIALRFIASVTAQCEVRASSTE